MEHKIDELLSIVSEYENDLSFKIAGDAADRVRHVLSQYKQIANNSIFEAKRFLEDAKTQFKALEIIIEGLTSEGMNHGQKRVIANHIITMLRSMVDKLDRIEYEYTTGIVEHYNFFRSSSPERKPYENQRQLKDRVSHFDALMRKLEEKYPEIARELSDEIPF